MRVVLKKPKDRQAWHRFFGIDPKTTTKVRIDDWDTWSLDYSLSQIILPLLERYKELNIGIPMKYETIDEWNEVVDKMIWSFQQLKDDNWEDQYYTGTIDFVTKLNDKGQYVLENIGDFEADEEGLRKHYERIQEGLILFGEHFMDLWW